MAYCQVNIMIVFMKSKFLTIIFMALIKKYPKLIWYVCSYIVNWQDRDFTWPKTIS